MLELNINEALKYKRQTQNSQLCMHLTESWTKSLFVPLSINIFNIK